MNEASEAKLSEILLAEIRRNGVTHVVWLPHSETNQCYLLMKAEPSLHLIGVSREGLAFSLAAGLYAGGKIPMIFIQNTGLMESGDSLRGWAIDMSIPVVVIVGYRGWNPDGAATSTAAAYTEQFLQAFGIHYYLVEKEADAQHISLAFEEAGRSRRPVVVLVGKE